jgi:hypothetical protein
LFPLDACAVEAFKLPPALDPQAASSTPAVAVNEQDSSLCTARKGADIGAA